MIGIAKFVRRHPMFTVLCTGLLTLGSLSAVVVFYPHWVDSQLLEKLGSSDHMIRGQAILDAGHRAKRRVEMKDKLVASLDTSADTRFYAAVSALNRAGLFKSSVSNLMHIDRAMALELATTPEADTQLWILSQVIKNRRDNKYVHQALKAAAASKSAYVRASAALLAALLTDDATLAALLEDAEPSVQAAAALDAGLARRETLGDALVAKLSDSRAEVSGSAATGLAHMNGDKYGDTLCKLLLETKDADLRQRLCWAMTILKSDQAARTVGKLLTSARGNRTPSPMALVAAGKLQVTEAEEDIRTVLAAAARDGKINRYLVHSAVTAAGALKLPVRTELHQICLKYWNPDWRSELMFASAAGLLGQQAAADANQGPDAPTKNECQDVLIRAAYYTRLQTTTEPAEPEGRVLTTPIASAAAAAAIWLLNPTSDTSVQLKQVTSDSGAITFAGRGTAGARIVMDAAEASVVISDYIAWTLAHSGRPEAFEMGLRMLPAGSAPLDEHVYNENVRGAGATLLALAAKTDEQKQIAAQRIRERLEPADNHSGEDDPVLAGRYRCALLILGDRNLLDKIRDQRNNGGHAVPAAFGALMLAGDIEAFDYLLYNTHIPAQDVASYMIYDGLDRVLAACAGSLPTIEISAPPKIQLWHANIVRDYYVIHRDTILQELKQ